MARDSKNCGGTSRSVARSFELGTNDAKITFEDEEGTSTMVLTLALLPGGPKQISLLPKQ
jgi:hypothetical protein